MSVIQLEVLSVCNLRNKCVMFILSRITTMDENSLEVAAAKIKSQYRQATVLLFGSQAKGIPGKGSDIDLCVILDNPLHRTLDISRQIRKEIHPLLKQSLDILVYDKKTFNERSACPLTMEAEIAESAREL